MFQKVIGKIWGKVPRIFRLNLIRLTQQKFTVSVASIITNEEGKVLLLEHILRPGSGWGIAGGFVEHGEQPEEAIRREVREETGLELKNPEMLRVRTIGRHVEILFRAEATGEAAVKSYEISALGWFRIEEMPEKMSTVQKLLVEKVLRGEI